MDNFDNIDALLRWIITTIFPQVRSVLRNCFPELDDHDLEDVHAETLVHFWEFLPQYDPGKCPLRPFLFVIARRKAIDLLRNKQKSPRTNVDIDQVSSPESRPRGHEKNGATGFNPDVLIKILLHSQDSGATLPPAIAKAVCELGPDD